MKTLLPLIFIGYSFSLQAQLCDPNPSSLKFDGSSSYVSFPQNNDLDITNKITVEAWIYATAWGAAPDKGSIVCKHGWTLGEKGYVLRAGGNGQLSFNIAGVSSGGNPQGWKEVVSSSGSMQLNTWYHVAGTFDGHKLRIYINGVQEGSLNFNGSIDASPDYDLKVGRIADMGAASGRFWSGMIDDVRIWDKAVSQQDLSHNMDEQISSQSNDLVAYWQFNEASGSSTDDAAGSINGTIHNATWNTSVGFTNGVSRPTITQNGNHLTSSSLLGNQWNLNGVPIAGETGATYTPQGDGNYSVTVTGLLGCDATSEDFIIAASVGINNPNETSLLYSIVDRTLTFVSVPAIYNNSQLQLFDIKGSEVVRNENLNQAIDLQSLSPGLYIMSVVSDGNSFRKKILLN